MFDQKGDIISPFQNPMFLSVVSYVYGRVQADQRECGVTDEDVMEDIEEGEKNHTPLFAFPYAAFLVSSSDIGAICISQLD